MWYSDFIMIADKMIKLRYFYKFNTACNFKFIEYFGFHFMG